MAQGEALRALDFMGRMGFLHYLNGDRIDLGCGPEPIFQDAVGVNRGGVPPVRDLDVDALSGDLENYLKGRLFDAVFSSHCLEHLYSPINHNLRHWLKFVKHGGFLVLYLPDERYYPFDPADLRRRNPEHFHRLTMDSFSWHLDQLQGAEVLHLAPDVDVRHGKYSFLAVLRKS